MQECLLRLRGHSETEEEGRESESNLPTGKAVVATQRTAQGRVCVSVSRSPQSFGCCRLAICGVSLSTVGLGEGEQGRGLRSCRRSWAIDWAARSSQFLHAVPLPRVADLSWAASQDRL